MSEIGVTSTAAPCTPIELKRTGELQPDEALEQEVRNSVLERAERELLCRRCGAPVTREGLRLEIEGRHVHVRINPLGIEFEFGCFREAPGAIVVGVPTPEHSWFRGFLWSYSTCGACAAHLGWLFEGDAGSFHGLILDRLASGPPDATDDTIRE